MGSIFSKSNSGWVSRGGWGARDPVVKGPPLALPVPCVYLTAVSSTNSCMPVLYRQDIVRFLRELQKINMYDEGLPDIAYNFYIGADGRAYEGRGWAVQPSLSEKENPNDVQTLAVAYIQQVPGRPPSEMMIDRVRDVISKGLQERYLYEQYVVAGLFEGLDQDQETHEYDE